MAVNKLPIISRNILYIRKVKFKTQQALADEICVTKGAISQWEKGSDNTLDDLVFVDIAENGTSVAASFLPLGYEKSLIQKKRIGRL